jgi:class 3 adenylate cyclase
LSEYFSIVVEIIKRHCGGVVQFQGDVILATFNVPVSDPNYVGNVVKAAKEIYIAVSQRDFAGHQLPIRVG